MNSKIIIIIIIYLISFIQVNRPLAMRKEGIQTRKRKPKQTSNSSGLSSLSSVLASSGTNNVHNNGASCNETSLSGPHSSVLHSSIHNSLINNQINHNLESKHGFHHHNSQQAAAAAAAAAAAVAAAVADVKPHLKL